MRDFAIVKSVDGQKIEVVSLISYACLACNSIECAKQGKSFHVINKKNLPVKENNILRIGFPRVLNGVLGLISLIVPIFASAVGFFLSPLILSRLGFPVTEFAKALITAACFLISSFVVFLVSRTDIHLTEPEVIQIM